jgi:hypothetical protein
MRYIDITGKGEIPVPVTIFHAYYTGVIICADYFFPVTEAA